MSVLIPQSELNAAIGAPEARRLYEDGALRWRIPHHGRSIAPSGLDLESMDFRGVRAAFSATETLPRDFDDDGNRLPGDPAKYKLHYDLGLSAVRNAGMLPLDERFEAGYTRWADAVIADAAKRVQLVQDTGRLQQDA